MAAKLQEDISLGLLYAMHLNLRERQAQAVGRRQGRKVVRHGMFLLN